MRTSPEPAEAWHTLSVEETARRLRTDAIRVADGIVGGTGPAAVADRIRELIALPWLRLPPAGAGRRRLILGSGEDGCRVDVPLRGHNLLVAGDPKSGKSWVAGLMTEQLILQRYSVCVIDPKGTTGRSNRCPALCFSAGTIRRPGCAI